MTQIWPKMCLWVVPTMGQKILGVLSLKTPIFGPEKAFYSQTEKKFKFSYIKKQLIQLSSNFAGILLAPGALRAWFKIRKFQTNMADGGHLGFLRGLKYLYEIW
jgi:hypothetical protein